MALSTLKATTRYVSILIATVEYRELFDRVSIRATAPVIPEMTFANENTSGEKSIGTEELTIGFGSLLKKGAIAANPFIPLASFQQKAFVVQYDTGCTVSGTLNVQDANPNATAGQTGRNEIVAHNTGTYLVAWHYS